MLKKYLKIAECGKYIWILVLFAGLLIGGCGSQNSGINDEKQEKIVENSVEATVVEEAGMEDEQEVLWSAEEKSAEVKFLESNFGDGIIFRDMEEEQVLSYVKSIESGFEFIGRVSDDGYGYILAFQKGNENIFEGYDQYWMNQDFVVVERNEQTDEERVVYRLPNVWNLYPDTKNEVLLIQPEDMAEPRELTEAFIQRFCKGEEGRAYLDSVMERGVRFTPPTGDEGYLEVYKYENGKQRLEYVVLTSEEEAEILNSDALIIPDWYGKYGLQYYVSLDVYKEKEIEEGPITWEALKIAEERCNFVAMNISEIRDISKASLRMQVPDLYGEQEEILIEITDPSELQELEDIFSSAETFYEGKCPYRGILTLTREDGLEMVLSLAIDSCDGFVFGSYGFYTVGKEKTARIWEIFDEAREFTGWKLEE